jgi:hypothetical protein
MKLGSAARDEAIDRAVAGVSDLLLPLGFKKTRRCEWKRISTWKTEEVDLMLSRGETVFLPSLRMALGKMDVYVAQTNVAKVIRPDSNPQFVKIPSLSPKTGAFVRVLVDEIRLALGWFDAFETPARCKAYVARYLDRKAPLYVEAMAYLDAVSE